MRATVFLDADGGETIRLSTDYVDYSIDKKVLMGIDNRDDEPLANLVMTPTETKELAETLIYMADDCGQDSGWNPYPAYIPATPGKYFITADTSAGRFVEIVHWTGREFNLFVNCGGRGIIAWRPISEPKPYRGE